MIKLLIKYSELLCALTTGSHTNLYQDNSTVPDIFQIDTLYQSMVLHKYKLVLHCLRYRWHYYDNNPYMLIYSVDEGCCHEYLYRCIGCEIPVDTSIEDSDHCHRNSSHHVHLDNMS